MFSRVTFFQFKGTFFEQVHTYELNHECLVGLYFYLIVSTRVSVVVTFLGGALGYLPTAQIIPMVVFP